MRKIIAIITIGTFLTSLVPCSVFALRQPAAPEQVEGTAADLQQGLKAEAGAAGKFLEVSRLGDELLSLYKNNPAEFSERKRQLEEEISTAKPDRQSVIIEVISTIELLGLYEQINAIEIGDKDWEQLIAELVGMLVEDNIAGAGDNGDICGHTADLLKSEGTRKKVIPLFYNLLSDRDYCLIGDPHATKERPMEIARQFPNSEIIVVGDLLDRGHDLKEAKSLTNRLIWGDHDLWALGAILGSTALLAQWLQINYRYNNEEVLEQFGLNLEGFKKYARDNYGHLAETNDPEGKIKSRIKKEEKKEDNPTEAKNIFALAALNLYLKARGDWALLARLPEGQVTRKENLEEREEEVIEVVRGEITKTTAEFTPDQRNILEGVFGFTEEEKELLTGLKLQLAKSKEAQDMRKFLMEGSLFEIIEPDALIKNIDSQLVKATDGEYIPHRSALLIHGLIPTDEDGNFMNLQGGKIDNLREYFEELQKEVRKLNDNYEELIRKGITEDSINTYVKENEGLLDMLFLLADSYYSPVYGKKSEQRGNNVFGKTAPLVEYRKEEESNPGFEFLQKSPGVCNRTRKSFGLGAEDLIVVGHTASKDGVIRHIKDTGVFLIDPNFSKKGGAQAERIATGFGGALLLGGSGVHIATANLSITDFCYFGDKLPVSGLEYYPQLANDIKGRIADDIEEIDKKIANEVIDRTASLRGKAWGEERFSSPFTLTSVETRRQPFALNFEETVTEERTQKLLEEVKGLRDKMRDEEGFQTGRTTLLERLPSHFKNVDAPAVGEVIGDLLNLKRFIFEWRPVFEQFRREAKTSPDKYYTIYFNFVESNNPNIDFYVCIPKFFNEDEFAIFLKYIAAEINNRIVTYGAKSLIVTSEIEGFVDGLNEYFDEHYNSGEPGTTISELVGTAFSIDRFKIVGGKKPAPKSFTTDDQKHPVQDKGLPVKIAGINFGKMMTKIGIAEIDEDGKYRYLCQPVSFRTWPDGSDTSDFQVLLKRTVSNLRQMLQDAKVDIDELDGIGISLGVLVQNNAITGFKGGLSAEFIPDSIEKLMRMQSLLSEEFPGKSIFVENDGNVEGLGLSRQYGYRNTLVLKFGNTLSSTFIDENGQIAKGINEFTKVVIDARDTAIPHITTKVKGGAGLYISWSGIENNARLLGIYNKYGFDDTDEVPKILHQWITGDDSERKQDALTVFTSVGECIAALVRTLEPYYEIDHVVISGSILLGMPGQIIANSANEALGTKEKKDSRVVVASEDETELRYGYLRGLTYLGQDLKRKGVIKAKASAIGEGMSPQERNDVMAAFNAFEAEFDATFDTCEIEPVDMGRINTTYYLTEKGNVKKRYVAQRLKPIFDTTAMSHNLQLVERAQLSAGEDGNVLPVGWKTVHFLNVRGTTDKIYHDAQGAAWRVMKFIPDVLIFSAFKEVPKEDREDAARSYGAALATFIRILGFIPIQEWQEPLPNFHNHQYHFEYLKSILQGEELSLSLSRAKKPPKVKIQGGIREGIYKHRIDSLSEDIEARKNLAISLEGLGRAAAHNDTAIYNALFHRNPATGRLECVGIIDLDTVQVGNELDDIGDALRSIATLEGEEAIDPYKITIDKKVVQCAIEGFLEKIDEFYGEEKVRQLNEHIYTAAKIYLFELCVRFFADFLVGNQYFSNITAEDSNLYLAERQMKTLKAFEKAFPSLEVSAGASGNIVGLTDERDLALLSGVSPTVTAGEPVGQIEMAVAPTVTSVITIKAPSFGEAALVIGHKDEIQRKIVELLQKETELYDEILEASDKQDAEILLATKAKDLRIILVVYCTDKPVDIAEQIEAINSITTKNPQELEEFINQLKLQKAELIQSK